MDMPATEPTVVHDRLARELLRLLARSPNHELSIVAAKDRLCGEHRLISEFHIAMGYAASNGWISYSRDYLGIVLSAVGMLVAATRAA